MVGVFGPGSIALSSSPGRSACVVLLMSEALSYNSVSVFPHPPYPGGTPLYGLYRHGFCTLVLNWVCFLEEATFSSLSIRPSTKALHNDFNIGLTQGTNYKAGLKLDIDLRIRS